MKRKPVTPLLSQVFKKIAPRIGARVVIEPEWQFVGQIIFKNGRKRYYRTSSLDLNTLGASEIARDKDYANFFMKRMGYPTIPGKTFFSDAWAKAIDRAQRGIDAAYRYAKSLGFPVIVKPNSGSRGVGVALVHDKAEFYRAMREVYRHDRVGIVQRPVRGDDYRIVVLNDKVISAYRRLPLSVVGDGRATIEQLLTRKQRAFVAEGRDTLIKDRDPRIAERLGHIGASLRSIPGKGQRIQLLDNANLSTGGDSEDVTHLVHPSIKKVAVKLTRDMGLHLCGVDLMIESDIGRPLKRYHVIEINSAPGLDHYAKSGKAQERIVEDLYLEVLKGMEHSQ